jgi:transposase InsO family protein
VADDRLAPLIARVFTESYETYGAPRIQAELADEHGWRVGRKRVARLMRELGLAGVSRRRKGIKTTVRAKEAPAAADLVRRQFQASGPDRLWVADITYVSSWEGYVFLACVIDAWSRKVVGWSMRDDLRSELVVDGRRPKPGLVHHSDRGSQYTSLAFGKTIEQAGVLPSMGRRGDAFRQRCRRELLRHTRDRAARPPYIPQSRPGAPRGLYVHRGLLQQPAPTLDARSAKPRSLRRDDDEGGHSGSGRCLKLRCQQKRVNSTLASGES